MDKYAHSSSAPGQLRGITHPRQPRKCPVTDGEEEFVSNLANEVHEFLTEKASEFLRNRLRQDPDKSVLWKDVFSALMDERKREAKQSVSSYVKSVVGSERQYFDFQLCAMLEVAAARLKICPQSVELDRDQSRSTGEVTERQWAS